MYSETGLELAQAQQGVLRLHRIDVKLSSLLAEQQTLAAKLAEFDRKLNKENADVERLERTSIPQLFYSVLGRLDAKIDEQQREALAAQMKYSQAARDIEEIRKEVEDLSTERVQYADSETSYTELFSKKKFVLMESGTQAGQLLMDMTEKLEAARYSKAQTDEAISAGSAALFSLQRILDCLGSAEDWGNWDLIGGGILCDLAKHSDIDDARVLAEKSQYLLRQFRTELADVKIETDLRVEVGDFTSFADFFFDGLIADWCMQTEIYSAQENVTRVFGQVKDVLEKLTYISGQQAVICEDLKTEIDNTVMNA